MNYEDWKTHWTQLIDKCEKNGYESLSETERVWYNTRVLIDSADNGGLVSFYYNSGADRLEETMEDLKKLKASKIIKLLEKINKHFPNGKPSRDTDERNEIIETWTDKTNEKLEQLDEQFYELEEDLEIKLEPYITKIISIQV